MKDKIELKIREEELEDILGDDEENPVIYAKRNAVGFLLGEMDPITDEEVEVPTSDEELEKIINILKKERANIPEYSMFGDPNWKVIDAQISICEWAKG